MKTEVPTCGYCNQPFGSTERCPSCKPAIGAHTTRERECYAYMMFGMRVKPNFYDEWLSMRQGRR